MRDLSSILGEERFDKIRESLSTQVTKGLKTSVLIKKTKVGDFENQIIIKHTDAPSLDYVLDANGYTTDDYTWIPVKLYEVIFTDIENTYSNIGDVFMITYDGVFELTNAIISEDNYLVYESASLRN